MPGHHRINIHDTPPNVVYSSDIKGRSFSVSSMIRNSEYTALPAIPTQVIPSLTPEPSATSGYNMNYITTNIHDPGQENFQLNHAHHTHAIKNEFHHSLEHDLKGNPINTHLQTIVKTPITKQYTLEPASVQSSKDDKRLKHIQSEQKRRRYIKHKFHELKTLLPKSYINQLHNQTKSNILKVVYEYLVFLINTNLKIRTELSFTFTNNPLISQWGLLELDKIKSPLMGSNGPYKSKELNYSIPSPQASGNPHYDHESVDMLNYASNSSATSTSSISNT